MGFAENTKVSVDRSQAEIRKTLLKYNSTGVACIESPTRAKVVFEMKNRRVQFSFDLAVYEKTLNKNRILMSRNQVEQENRRLWRCVLLAIKSKLESVESGITSFDQEFMAHMMLPNGNTVGEIMIPQLDQCYSDNQMPPLLGYGS